MIGVTIELDPFGRGKDKTDLVVIGIANDGTGERDVANYNYVISHQEHLYEDGLPTAGELLRGQAKFWKRGRVLRFHRRLGAAKLLAAVMKDAFPSGGRR